MPGDRRSNEPRDESGGGPADPEQVARLIVLRRLDVAPRTRAQLARTLRERNVPDDVASRVLDRFEEVGLVDDRTFAALWVESRMRTRGLSARALRLELRTKGVTDDLIDEALSALDPGDEMAAARAVARRKARSVSGLAHATQVRRVAGALARKGYGAGITAQIVRETLTASDAAGGDPAIRPPFSASDGA